jgi:hypothetical protein
VYRQVEGATAESVARALLRVHGILFDWQDPHDQVAGTERRAAADTSTIKEQ